VAVGAAHAALIEGRRLVRGGQRRPACEAPPECTPLGAALVPLSSFILYLFRKVIIASHSQEQDGNRDELC